MGYYTYFNGKIDYSNVPELNQRIIEKIYDTIDLMQWHCSASYQSDIEIHYYGQENEWIHYYHGVINKENKVIDFSHDDKNYYDSAQTVLSFIAPYLDKNTKYLIEFNGESDYEYDDDGNEIDPEPNSITIENCKIFVNGKLFETSNTFSFPLPLIKPRERY